MYIVDSFVIGTHSEHLHRSFNQNLSHHHPTIKFTALWSAEEVTLLDTSVYLRDGLIGTHLHIQPTNKKLYVQMESSHSHHVAIHIIAVTSIPYSQVLNLCLFCLEENNLLKWTHKHKKTRVKARQMSKEHIRS